MVTLQTSKGDIVIALDIHNTPKTVLNFLRYAKNGFYENTVFHRVMEGFMIQGGGYRKNMASKYTYEAIANEADLGQKNKRGTIAMARTSDPDSATSQFFINLVDNDFLNFKEKNQQGWGYCVFGEVISGMEVVDAIAKVPTAKRDQHEYVPLDPVVIERVTVKS